MQVKRESQGWVLKFVTLLLAVYLVGSIQSAMATGDSESLAGQLLVADESIQDPRFRHSVLLIIRHNAKGALALMINHPTSVKLTQVFPDIEALNRHGLRMHIGGPVMDSGPMFLIDNPRGLVFEGAIPVTSSIFYSVNRLHLEAALNNPPASIKAYTGYAGWRSGQLESEMMRGHWVLRQADSRVIFDTPAADIWREQFGDERGAQWVMNRVVMDAGR